MSDLFWLTEAKIPYLSDSYDNALAETIYSLFNAEVIHRRGAMALSLAHDWIVSGCDRCALSKPEALSISITQSSDLSRPKKLWK